MDGARRARGRARRRLVALTMVGVAVTAALVVQQTAPADAAVPPGFAEVTAFSGLNQPTNVRFAPDGKVFVAEKRGIIQMYDSLGDTTATTLIDLRTEVHNFWDRGLLGLAVDPQFPARPYLYISYTFDAAIGGTAPRWGTAGQDSDPCPTPPGATGDGCVVSGKLARLTVNPANPAAGTTTKRDLIHDWCQQYPSHTVGDVVFGRDGALYVSGGDGASFTFTDYGQDGNPVNPCGDPPGGAGGALTPPSAEGGALRAQDLRTSADPVTLDGTVIRVITRTPAPRCRTTPTRVRSRRMPSGSSPTAFRNPFRMATRPGTDEIWLGDVGAGTWEELNRLPTPTTAVRNFGWPCYEGAARQAAFDAADLSICENLYAQPSAHTTPYFAYRHGQQLNARDNCGSPPAHRIRGRLHLDRGGAYPSEYDGALFFADYTRSCIWVMTRGVDGLLDRQPCGPSSPTRPDPSTWRCRPPASCSTWTWAAARSAGSSTARRRARKGSTSPSTTRTGR